ncbi:SDR family oxidoreductase [Chitinophaga caseinilytica]|uniref:SDR family oxidoreductase n=1 Tax=Chitinophaga caseinilytica TaxID=2267521 RepID=A0ABZ2Z6N3_9BACT
MTDLKNLSFLITGGAGFIGSNLAAFLVKNKAKKVRVLDNLATGHLKNIEALRNEPNFEFIEGDIRNLDTCLDACRDIDVISHQAALGSVPRSIVDPITSNEVNITGFLNILLAAKESNINRVVYAASSSTYGDSKSLPKVEDKIGMPLSPYAVTKYVNELYAHVFHLNYGLNTIGLRYFNVFGPQQDPNGAYAAVIPLFIQSILQDKSPYLNGDGEQTRDFTFIENVIQANVKALTTENPAALNQVYNVAVGERTSLKQMFEILRSVENKNIEAIHREARKGDIMDSLADITKARTLLDYQPAYTFRQGLQITYNWYKDNQEFINR